MAGRVDFDGSGLAERSSHHRDGKFRGVAVATQMSEDNLTQSGGKDSAGQVSGSAVGEVSVGREDALFDGEGASGVGVEHFLVVVGLDEQSVNLLDLLNDGRIYVAEVGQDSKAEMPGADGESYGISSIMRYRKGGYLKRSQAERTSFAKSFPRSFGMARVVLPQLVGGQAGGVNGAPQRAK